MASATVAHRGVAAPRMRLRALRAQRLIDLIALRIAPALAAGLIATSHLGSAGEGLLVFAAVFTAAQALARLRLPLRLMPAAQLVLRLASPAAGVAITWLIITAGPGGNYPVGSYEAIVLGAWLVLALGIWLRARLAEGLRARVAVIGPSDFAADLATELAADEPAPYEIVGWLAGDGPSEHASLRRLGGLDEVRRAVIEERIELLVCAAEAVDQHDLEEIWERVADQCLDLPVRMLTANQLYEETFGHVPVGTIDAAWYRYIMHPRFRTSAPASKRVFDLFVGGLIALLGLPVLAAAAIAIKLTDGGPIFYRQRRFGERGRAFEIIKLRTMRVDAESAGPQWSGADDERVTRVGRLLRRSHVDEIPQLWNLLRGEMTLVGPRPERPEIVAELERRFPHYRRRQLVKPGITGWAQLRCGYGGSELGTAWKLCHDLYYIKHRSLIGDALILAETAFVAFQDAHRALRSPRQRFLLAEESLRKEAGG